MLAVVLAILVLVQAAVLLTPRTCPSPLNSNETRAMLTAQAIGWRLPTSETSVTVLPVDLVDACNAGTWYDGIEVLIPLRTGKLDNGQILWWVGPEHEAPALVLIVGNNEVGPPCWVVGKCRGLTRDNQRRSRAGVVGVVVVGECRVIPWEK